MATDRAVELVEFDNVWGITTAGIFSIRGMEEGVSCTMVVIPINQIDGMSHKDIGRMVELLAPKADRLAHLEMLSEKELVEEQKQRVCRESKKPTDGWIYVLKDPYGHYKVGMTTRTPGERLCEFTPKLPFEVDFLFAIETNDAPALEYELHERFEDKRVQGEWFKLDWRDVEHMRGLI